MPLELDALLNWTHVLSTQQHRIVSAHSKMPNVFGILNHPLLHVKLELVPMQIRLHQQQNVPTIYLPAPPILARQHA